MIDPDLIHNAIRHEGGVSRRLFLAYGATLASIPIFGVARAGETHPPFSADPFSLGVASGDPDASGVVLWTRLAPAPLEPEGGMLPLPVEVRWEIAEDEAFQKIAGSGRAFATPQLGHSVHVVADGLKPDHWYWYRFHAGDATSPIGRTRTLPAAGTMPDRVRFAFASCQNYEQGLFTAYEQMAKDDLDLVFHLGDYIYEHSARDNQMRQHLGGETESLTDYRVRYSQYRADPLLQQMHAQCPWFVTWDDHEFDNNCANDISEEEGIDPAEFLIRRAAAYQVYYEMMPLRPRSLPRGPDLRLYRRASFGRLAEFMVLDTRQYRTDQPNGDRKSPLNDEAFNPASTLLGKQQRNWLCQSLIRSQGTWNVLAQQVMMGLVDRLAKDDAGPEYSMDQWPGYAAERRQLLEFMADRKVPNPVVLTGDIHSNWVNELRFDDRQPELPVVAAEFVGTSISSGGDGDDAPKDLASLLSHNPCLKFHNRQRGHVRCTLTPETWTSDYLVVDQVSKPGGKVSQRASFVLESGRPEIHEA